jgi:hypothetical protein
MAKTVSDCGQGCMITMSEATYGQLDLDAHEQALVLHCGEFRSAYCPSLHIYQARLPSCSACLWGRGAASHCLQLSAAGVLYEGQAHVADVLCRISWQQDCACCKT